jgi:hypothetical protein
MIYATLTIDVGLLRRKDARRALQGLKSRGAKIEWTEGSKWRISSDWKIRGPLNQINLVKAMFGGTEEIE